MSYDSDEDVRLSEQRPEGRVQCKCGLWFYKRVFEAHVLAGCSCKCSVIAGNVVPNPECPVHVEVVEVAPSRSAAPEPTIDDAVKLIKKMEACEGMPAKLILLRNFVGTASAAPPSANCVYEIRPDDPPPSCHVCGAVMMPTRFNCRSCGATTEPTEAAPPSEREALSIEAHTNGFAVVYRRNRTVLISTLTRKKDAEILLANIDAAMRYEFEARAAVPQAAAEIELCGDKYSDAFLDAPDSVHLCELPKGHENHQDATMWWKFERKANA